MLTCFTHICDHMCLMCYGDGVCDVFCVGCIDFRSMYFRLVMMGLVLVLDNSVYALSSLFSIPVSLCCVIIFSLPCVAWWMSIMYEL